MFPRWFFLMPDSPSQMKLGKESRFRSHKTCRFGVGQSQLCHCLAAWVQWGTVLTGEQQHGAAHIPQQVSAWCPVPLLKEDPWGLYPSAGQATVTQQCSSWHSTERKSRALAGHKPAGNGSPGRQRAGMEGELGQAGQLAFSQ